MARAINESDWRLFRKLEPIALDRFCERVLSEINQISSDLCYACWHVARLLVQRGANVDKLWHAAALGMLDRLEELLGGPSGTEPEAVSQAFWHACAAGQRRAAELLVNRGADLNWVPDYAQGTPLDAAGGLGTRRNNVIGWLRDQGAQSSEQPK